MTRAMLLLSLLLGASWAGCSRRGLTNEQLSAVVESNRSSLNGCYDAALVQEPVTKKLESKATLVVEPSGEVRSVYVPHDLPLPGLADCLQEQIGKWEFPKAPGETRTTLPLVFEPKVVKGSKPPPMIP